MRKLFVKIRRAIKLLKQLLIGYKENRFSNAYLMSLLDNSNSNYPPNQIRFNELGPENPGRTIGMIKFPEGWIPTAGFFALMHRMLCGLYFADFTGMTPVVDAWTNCAYEEEDAINGTKNVFEYYFEPLSDVSMPSALNSRCVVKILNPNMDFVLNKHGCEWFDMSEAYIEEMGRLYRKYIRFNKKTQIQLQKDTSKVLGNKKTLGVHFRGTDYVIGAAGHPVALQVEDYFEEIDKAIKECGFQKIFVATDDLNALRKFKQHYGRISYYKDVLRSEGRISVAFLERKGVTHPKYRSGYEVLRDAYTLSLCDGLISGKSQVPTNARISRASTGVPFKYCKVISRGIHRTGVDWVSEFEHYADKKS